MMLPIVELALAVEPRVQPTLFVDDVSTEMVGPVSAIIKGLGRFLKAFVGDTQSFGMELSRSKSVCLASTDKIGRMLQAALASLGISFVR